ncbi:MAG: formate hydrogenase [Leptospiraceae bacterium]|nr:formate hydrogenase [Leptospiraceae bacterium]
MANLLHLLTFLVLIGSIPVGIFLEKNFFGEDFPIFVGLLLQVLIGNAILFYIRGYEKDKKPLPKIYFGYFLFFLGLSGSFLAGKTIWLLIFWETSTFGAIFIFGNHFLGDKENGSLIALFAVSGISLIFLAMWVFLPHSKIGIQFLLIGLLAKGGFSGMHLWLPEAHSGPPAHGSASFSGLMVNVPLLLFVRYVTPDWNLIGWDIALILFAGVGVFFGGVTAFFNNNVKRSLAYSTIEMLNFLWLCIFVVGYWGKSSDETTNLIGKSFLVLFYITLFHHSISKSFQFLSLGYLCKLKGDTNIDSCKGIGRISGISSIVLGFGTFSFGGIPGSIGFLSESTFLFLGSEIIDLPFGSSVYVLPAILFILFGIVLGVATHFKLYFPIALSIPDENIPEKVAPEIIKNSLKFLGILIFSTPIILYLAYQYYHELFQIPQNLKIWLDTLFLVSIASSLFYLSLVLFRWSHKVKERKSWDCGNKYDGSELSIHSSVISAPLHTSIGRYFNNFSGESKVDGKLFMVIHKTLDLGKFWISRVESGAVSNYLAFSALCLLASIALLFTFKNF